MRHVPTSSVGPGLTMPTVGFGTFLIPDEQAASAVETAIGLGYRHIDTAESYRNESGVGEGIRAAAARHGLSRGELFVTSKVFPGNEAWGMTAKGHQATLDAIQASLDRLKLDYVDLYLVHAPFNPGHRLEVWGAMVALQAQGRARAVGVSNYAVAHIAEIQSAGLPLPAANQIELHPWSQRPELVAWLVANGVLPIAYSSLLPLASWRSEKGQASAKSDDMRAEGAAMDSPFLAMARKHGVTPAQVLLRWAVQQGFPVLPKSTKPERMRENLDLFSFALDDVDMRQLAAMDRGPGVAWARGDPMQAP
jgi:2,5-diketo-D-gluconate reductase A